MGVPAVLWLTADSVIPDELSAFIAYAEAYPDIARCS